MFDDILLRACINPVYLITTLTVLCRSCRRLRCAISFGDDPSDKLLRRKRASKPKAGKGRCELLPNCRSRYDGLGTEFRSKGKQILQWRALSVRDSSAFPSISLANILRMLSTGLAGLSNHAEAFIVTQPYAWIGGRGRGTATRLQPMDAGHIICPPLKPRDAALVKASELMRNEIYHLQDK